MPIGIQPISSYSGCSQVCLHLLKHIHGSDHLIVFVIAMIRRELMHFVHMRHQFLISKSHSRLAQARTVLITEVPTELANEKDLRQFASFIPGGVDKVWIYRDTKELNKAFEKREKLTKKLEGAENKLLRKAMKEHGKRVKASEKAAKRNRLAKDAKGGTMSRAATPANDLEKQLDNEDPSVEEPESKDITEETKAADVDRDATVRGSESIKASPEGGDVKKFDSEETRNGDTTAANPEVVESQQKEDKSAVSFKDDGSDASKRALLASLVPAGKRPHHRLGPIPFVGRKVDTIDYCTTEIAKLNKRIAELRREVGKGKFQGSVFIRCNLQMGAHILAQCVSFHEPLRMYDKFIEASPKDIVWSNLDDGAAEVKSRQVLSWVAQIGLIVVWAVPVSFAGTLSNLSSLCTKISWLAWVCKAPSPLPGMIEGILPPVLLAVLLLILPMVLRWLAWFEGIPRYSLISVSLYKRYFLFLLVNGFLIVTLTSGITAAITDIIESPVQTVPILAARLPLASIFFLTYMVTQGLAGAGMALIQLGSLVMHYIQKWFLGRTPRQAYGVNFVMPHVSQLNTQLHLMLGLNHKKIMQADFGVVLPRLSLLATIAFSYSIISPIINALALIGTAHALKLHCYRF